MPAGCPRSRELLENNSIRVIPLCLDQIQGGFGAILLFFSQEGLARRKEFN
ncbi:MAG: hypothetical protein ACLTK0_01990 [Anaerovoracaceae bacterium]